MLYSKKTSKHLPDFFEEVEAFFSHRLYQFLLKRFVSLS
ncbi:hypothetical protein SSIN_0403 [Streptococcus sinensis]|uniref:Uncharacterized protein n=1 Tax=Streptococcus sinensis TaxID=176090 RepID=A0A0A0DLI3_9STRE|nr:hypothetical protein SSIN_0403 [Streptococcus sinensis]